MSYFLWKMIRCENFINPWKAGGMFTSHLDGRYNGGWDIDVPGKQFWVIALLGPFSIF